MDIVTKMPNVYTSSHDTKKSSSIHTTHYKSIVHRLTMIKCRNVVHIGVDGAQERAGACMIDHGVLFSSGAGNGKNSSFVLHSLVSYCISSRSWIAL